MGERDTCDQWCSYHLSEKKTSSRKKTVNIIEKLVEDLKKHFTERENPNSQVMERCGSAQVAGEMQMVILYPSSWQKSKSHLLMAS